jgi:peptidoglycan hydrolase CwlO-like protein
MEAYLPIIQTTLDEWLQLTLAQPLYAAALVISIWLLTSILYSIKMAGLKKKNLVSEQARTTAETTLNTAQQQLQQTQNDTLALTEQLAQQQKTTTAEQQRAQTAEQQLTKRNQDIAATIQSLASSFDIGERPLPVPENPKADDLWQQHDKVIKQLIERLRTEQLAKTELETFYQAEKTKLAATEAQLVSLQTNLDSQTSLVLALQTQTTSLQQQQNDTQRDLTDALKKHQADLTRLLQLEQQATSVAHTPSPVAAPIAPVTPTPVAQVTAVTEEIVVSPSVTVDDSAAKMQDLFKKPQPAPVIPEPEISALVQVAEPEPIIPEFASFNEPAELTPVESIREPEPIIVDVVEKTPKTSALKGMYKKFTTSKAEPKPEPVAVVKQTPEKSSALKGLYKKFTTSKPEQTESVPAPILPIVEPEPMPVMQIVEPEPAPAPAPAPVAPVVELVTKTEVIEKSPEKPSDITQLQGLYPKHTAPKIQIKDLAPESFDNSSNKLEDVADQITEKLEKMKGLYGKMFSKNKE